MAKKALAIDILFVPNPKKEGVVSLGDVYVGQPSTDPEVSANRINVTIVQEDGNEILIQPAEQPLNTGAGGVLLYQGSPVTVLVDGEYSLKINDNLGQQVYYVPSQNAETSVSLGGGKIINGSFEAITGTAPDNWLLAPTGTGTIESDDTQSSNGLASLKFTSIDALGSGSAKSDAFDVDTGEGVDVNFMLLTTGALTRNTVQIEWLNSSGNVVSTVTVADFNAGDSPIAWTLYGVRSTNAPVGAIQARIILLGMNTGGGAMTGDAWFDGVRVNDHSITLGNAVTADSTNSLSNKTIVDGQYSGVQTGFIGDIAGNASTANVADSIVNQGALATLGVVDTAQIVNEAVTEAKLGNNSVGFDDKVKVSGIDGSIAIPTNSLYVLPKGIYVFDGLIYDTVNDVYHFAEYLINGTYRRQLVTSVASAGIVISDGTNCRLRNLTVGTWNALYRRLF